MQLPGGLIRNSTRRRDFAFRPLTGTLEMALADAGRAATSTPRRVTAALAVALEQLAGQAPEPAVVAELCVADRQYLMAALAAHLGFTQFWRSTLCVRCGAPFDFVVDYHSLPVKVAGQGFPFAEVETPQGRCRFRVPTGADQEVLAEIAGEEEALRCLVARCLLEVSAAPHVTADAFNDEDIARIEAALEATSPEMAVSAQATCPACGTVHDIAVDPYEVLAGPLAEDLFHEVHLLASSYHWSEKEILALPQQRRRRYLELIDQAYGLDE